MATKIRLRRMGTKKKPFYRIVIADSRSPRDGRFIENVGYYNPKTEPALINIKDDRAIYWLEQGAQPSDTVRSLLSKKGLIKIVTDKKVEIRKEAKKLREELNITDSE